MGASQRRRELRAKHKALKQARLKDPGRDSKYARKCRGIYPPRSPYLTGDRGVRMKALREPVMILPSSSASIYPRRQPEPSEPAPVREAGQYALASRLTHGKSGTRIHEAWGIRWSPRDEIGAAFGRGA